MTTIARSTTLAALALGLAFGLFACEKSSSPDQVTAPTTADADHAHADHDGHDHSGHDHASGSGRAGEDRTGGDQDAARVYAADFSFAIPEGWTQQPASNSMRLTELAAPPASPGTTAPVAAFSLAGGDIDMNIDRWRGQFAEADPTRSRETVQIAGATVHLVEMAGGYRGMGGGAPAQGTVMRAAIIERPGQGNLFIKMTGAGDAMNPLADAWTAMIQSMTSP